MIKNFRKSFCFTLSHFSLPFLPSNCPVFFADSEGYSEAVSSADNTAARRGRMGEIEYTESGSESITMLCWLTWDSLYRNKGRG
jgi:hypothetical protein